MSLINRRTAGLVALLALAVAAGADMRWWRGARDAARRSMAELEQRKLERERLGRESPAPTPENEGAIEADLELARQEVAAGCAALAVHHAPPGADPEAARPIEVYFELATFVERTRVVAVQSHVALKAEERFGFASHAQAGPDSQLIAAVRRQRVEIQYLLEMLFASGPRALLAVQRERPLAAPPPDRGAVASPIPTPTDPRGSPGVEADFFAIAPGLSLRRPGLIDSDAFRLEFAGQTPTLRAFLNSLAAGERPVVVRSVDVEPVDEGPVAAGEAAPSADAPVPLVTRNLSRFTIVVEVLAPPRQLEMPAT